jgi:hypothetical protein
VSVANAVDGLIQPSLFEGKFCYVFLSSASRIRAGELWLDRLRKELDKAKVLIALLSPKSVARPWVNFETGAAWVAGKTIIPVCFGGLLKEELPKPYSDFQAVSLEQEYNHLIDSVLEWIPDAIGHLGSTRARSSLTIFDTKVANLMKAIKESKK